MPTDTRAQRATAATTVVARVFVYYVAILALGTGLYRALPQARVLTEQSSVSVILAMATSALLSLPIAWIYQLTRSKRGYQQSVVQLLIILPMVVSGVVVLVKTSVPLAFSLAGIVAAVRFRNTLDDSKDAVYVFLATGIGLAAAVDLPVAAAISALFNLAVLILWFSDFGRTPLALDSKIAQRRLERAREMTRTGTFVARMDKEVLADMTAEQLEGIARRAWRRAKEHDPESSSGKSDEMRVRIRTNDPTPTREAVERQLGEFTKRWTFAGVVPGDDGVDTLEYLVHFKKSASPSDLIASLGALDDVFDVEVA